MAALNRCYSYVVSEDFSSTANALRDRLVEGAGFEMWEAASFVTAGRTEQGKLDIGSGRITITPVAVNLPEKPDLKDLPRATKAKVTWDGKKNVLTISSPLTAEETATLKSSANLDRIRFTLENRGTSAHNTRLRVEGLPQGNFTLIVNNENKTATQFSGGAPVVLSIPLATGLTREVKIKHTEQK